MKQERIEIHDIDDLAFCIKEYALADDSALTSDALRLKYSLLRAAKPLVDARVQLLVKALRRMVGAQEQFHNNKACGFTDDTNIQENWDAMKEGQRALRESGLEG